MGLVGKKRKNISEGAKTPIWIEFAFSRVECPDMKGIPTQLRKYEAAIAILE